MRLGCAEGVGIVLLAVLCACGGSSSPSARSGSEDGGPNPGQGTTGGSTGDGASHPCADVQSDTHNCGACSVVCSFANATPRCATGICARGVCASGWYDLDGDPGNGCEASCSGGTCTIGSGSAARTVTLSAPPLPESGVVASALASSGPVIASADEPPPVDLAGVLGEPTPLPYHEGDPANPTDAYVGNHNLLIENLVGYQAILH